MMKIDKKQQQQQQQQQRMTISWKQGTGLFSVVSVIGIIVNSGLCSFFSRNRKKFSK